MTRFELYATIAVLTAWTGFVILTLWTRIGERYLAPTFAPYVN